MKKIITLVVCLGLISLSAGCGNDQYSIEKRFWRAQKRAGKILKNPAASPPQELQRVVNILNNFALRYPQNILGLEAEFSIARLYMAKEEYAKARVQLKGLLSKYAKSDAISSEVVFLTGKTYEIENKWQPALEQYKKIMQQYPITLRGLDIPIYIARYYQTKYQPDMMLAAFQEAIAHYKALSAKYPNTPLAFNVDTLTAQCYMGMKEWQGAINTFNTIMEKYKGKIELDQFLINVALIYHEQLKDRANSIATLQKLIKEHPKSRLIKPAAKLLKKWSGK